MAHEPNRLTYGAPWIREESILAFELYCRIPFQRTKANNPAVQELARLLGRTPASVARKLGNFGAFDPELCRKEISGLTHTSKLDRQVWDEFHADWNGLVWAANEIRMKMRNAVGTPLLFRQPSGPSETIRLTKQRVHQSFFREAILSSYAAKCCITGLAIPECLIASHIIPWSEDERFRTDPTNGLCFSATFDRLFEAGLMTVTTELIIRFSSRITESKSRVDEELLCRYHNQPIRRPHRFLPAGEYLHWHHTNRFQQ
ncbi:MAG: restriction endonuclease [Deltaproteobacteria bacterium HGW-Deltaproteobacteria-15]|nr:MAG: restriction endonuclease [Deltaproteobacteria bacterium HGW-Deltaproteobacteria-15]